MRQWFLAGYFEPTIQILNRAIANAQWMMLKDVFPNIADAFLVVASNNSTDAHNTANAQEAQRQHAQGQKPNKERFDFPSLLPVPPKFKGVKKIYPSELKSGNKRNQVNITDLNGEQVKALDLKNAGKSS